MEEKERGFVFLGTFFDQIMLIPDDGEKLKAFMNICRYGLDEIEPDDQNSLAFIPFIGAKLVIDAQKKRRNANRKNGLKGGRPKGSAGQKKTSKKTEQNPKDNPTETQDKPKENPDKSGRIENGNPSETLKGKREKENKKELSYESSKKTTPTPTTAFQDYLILGKFQNVHLTQDQVNTLKREYPGLWEAKLDRLSTYMQSKGKSYADHYATLTSWLQQDARKSSGVYSGLLPSWYSDAGTQFTSEQERQKMLEEVEKARAEFEKSMKGEP
nr:DUF6291 domain-containing protein [Faecalibaculum rodentium]